MSFCRNTCKSQGKKTQKTVCRIYGKSSGRNDKQNLQLVFNHLKSRIIELWFTVAIKFADVSH